MRTATVFVNNRPAARLIEDGEGYHFEYLAEYLESERKTAVSLTLRLLKTWSL